MKRDKILIIGDHPIRGDVVGQYERRGATVTQAECYKGEEHCIGDYAEIVILSAGVEPLSAAAADAQVLSLLDVMASSAVTADTEMQSRPLTHVLLRCYSTLRMLMMTDLPRAVNECLDVYPFTMADTWAKNICVKLPGITDNDGSAHVIPTYRPLDRRPIDGTSSQRVHVVICGFGEQARSVAINVALSCHYPNYNEESDLPLRTRITIVADNLGRQRDEFIAMYRHLFDNSYWRSIDIDRRAVDFHEPMYIRRRKDFIDVEWEFVDAPATDPYVTARIGQWAVDDSRQLTIVVAGEDDEADMTLALSLPPAVYEQQTPVVVRQHSCALASVLSRSSRFAALRLFGMDDCGYDVSLPLVGMAKYLKYFYDCSYGSTGVPTVLPRADVEAAWKSEHSLKMRFSCIYNVMTIGTKMRSLGHGNDDCSTFYALTQTEIEALSRTEHNRWSVERLISGSRPCTDEERRAVADSINNILSLKAAGTPREQLPADLKRRYKTERDAHYDLCSYDELSMDATGRNVRVYDYDLTACIPLIVKSYNEDHGKEQLQR